MAYNPATGLVYYPGQETSMVAAMEEKFEYQEGRWNLGMRMGTRPGLDGKASENVPVDPKAPPMGGFFVAWNPVLKKAEWKIPFQSSGGALSTAGNLIFVGNSAGKLFALDPVSGKTLWESPVLQSGGVATPVTYELDGKQYVAVMAGVSKGRIFALALQ
jgi:quinohemoprotein ethanol dehydrogenase